MGRELAGMGVEAAVRRVEDAGAEAASLTWAMPFRLVAMVVFGYSTVELYLPIAVLRMSALLRVQPRLTHVAMTWLIGSSARACLIGFSTPSSLKPSSYMQEKTSRPSCAGPRSPGWSAARTSRARPRGGRHASQRAPWEAAAELTAVSTFSAFGSRSRTVLPSQPSSPSSRARRCTRCPSSGSAE